MNKEILVFADPVKGRYSRLLDKCEEIVESHVFNERKVGIMGHLDLFCKCGAFKRDDVIQINVYLPEGIRMCPEWGKDDKLCWDIIT